VDGRLAQLARAVDGALIATDFDGTLAPIVRNPSDARPVAGVVDVLVTLAEQGAQVAVVTGRESEVVLELGDLHRIPGLVVYGLHGAQRWHDGELTSQPEPPGLDRIRGALPSLIEPYPGVWVEDKGLGVVVHTRTAAEPDLAFRVLRPIVTKLAADNDMEVHPGKQVLEVRIPHVSKADSLRALLAPGRTAALFAGDDLGDLTAMQAVNAWGRRTRHPALTIAVGEVELLRDAADTHVDSPADLAAALAQLISEPPRPPRSAH
jgi:trehalose 6-phosphate phosphatase